MKIIYDKEVNNNKERRQYVIFSLCKWIYRVRGVFKQMSNVQPHMLIYTSLNKCVPWSTILSKLLLNNEMSLKK